MPIYGYRCSECGHELEVFQSMSDEPLRVCAECGGSLSKLLYPVGVHFKGSGFYSTDYKKNGAPASKSESAASGDSGSGDSGSGDSSTGGTKPASGESGSGAAAASHKSEPKKAEKKAESAASKE
jgi:putative FmdB family regulatory protein